MSSGTNALIIDLVEWVAREPRSYAELMDAWRTSCPRLTVWEDAVDEGLVRRETVRGVAMVAVTPAGRDALRRAGRQREAVAPVSAQAAE